MIDLDVTHFELADYAALSCRASAGYLVVRAGYPTIGVGLLLLLAVMMTLKTLRIIA